MRRYATFFVPQSRYASNVKTKFAVWIAREMISYLDTTSPPLLREEAGHLRSAATNISHAQKVFKFKQTKIPVTDDGEIFLCD